MRPFLGILGLSLLAVAVTCSVYDKSLVTGAGGSAQHGTTTGGGAGGADDGAGGSGGSACSKPADCPGADTDCQKRTCVSGFCGVQNTPAKTPIAQQTPGDCVEKVCDGMGGVKDALLDSDADDGKECTVDTCAMGTPTHTPKMVGTPCTQGGGATCNQSGNCVECVSGDQCPSQLCSKQFKCVPLQCTDMMKNGAETDVDCGGPDCPGCDFGKQCTANTDCVTARCGKAGTCWYGLLISEVESRGPAGVSDDFVELYNPAEAPVVLDDQWRVEARSSNATMYTARWTGKGLSIPAHGHYLIGGTAYQRATSPDGTLSPGITEAASVRLMHATDVIDAICYYFSTETQAEIQNGQGFSCEGVPIANPTGQMNVDRSMERLPGGAQGNGVDTDMNQNDFVSTAISNPQNINSPPTP